jgi:hypothetical protein
MGGFFLNPAREFCFRGLQARQHGETSMKLLCRFAAGMVTLAALTGPALADPLVSTPVAHDNLSVYFVRGNGSGGAAPLTLDEAVSTGQARVNWREGGPFTVENFSDRSIFVPFATLLAGGLQDQVTATSLLLSPHSGPISLATFCVDPFRSTARDDESPSVFTTPGSLFPARMAKLAMLAGAPDGMAVRNLRQVGVWWTIDSTRAALAAKLGEAMEPPYRPHWESSEFQDRISNPALADRQSPWTTSLPLALENPTLLQAEQVYADALAGAPGEDVIGAVFAINGNVEGAEIYQSHALFAAMWPKLLHAYAIAALAAGGENAQAAPPVEAVEEFLASAQAGAPRQGTSGTAIRDSVAAIYAETKTSDGEWINRSFVATAIPPAAAASPEASIIGMLKSGEINGRPIRTLDDGDRVVLHRAGHGGWWATISRPDDFTQQLLAALIGPGSSGAAAGGDSLIPIGISLAFFTLLGWLLIADNLHRGRIARRVAIQPRSVPSAMTYALPAPKRRAPVKAFAAGLSVSFRRALNGAMVLTKGLARWLAAAWAAWPPEGLVSALARNLGPAWPGNYRPSRPAGIRMPK